LINVQYGAVLTSFLNKIENLFMVKADKITDDLIINSKGYNGKLFDYGISVFIFEIIPGIVAIYLINWAIWIVYLYIRYKRMKMPLVMPIKH
jgi:hypothetical protein